MREKPKFSREDDIETLRLKAVTELEEKKKR
jgi:hypothetical protein